MNNSSLSNLHLTSSKCLKSSKVFTRCSKMNRLTTSLKYCKTRPILSWLITLSSLKTTKITLLSLTPSHSMRAKSYGPNNSTTEVKRPLLNLLRIRRNSTSRKHRRMLSSSHSNASEDYSKARTTLTKLAKSKRCKTSGKTTGARCSKTWPRRRSSKKSNQRRS